MKSPFPGMDPYLCARWSDVRLSLYALVSEAIQVMLPSALRSRIQEDLMDVSQGESGFLSPADSEMHIYAHPHVEREIHVIDITNGNKIITAIEILSPWNKTSGRLNKDYRKKLRDYDNAGVNIVEIDLLRSPGRGNMRITEGDLPLERRTPYLICIGDAQNPGGWDVYPISIRTPLPTIPIPLRPQDQPAMLNLQPLIERVYKAGGHDDIDYAKPLDPALPAEDSQWADNLLRAAGKRA